MNTRRCGLTVRHQVINIVDFGLSDKLFYQMTSNDMYLSHRQTFDIINDNIAVNTIVYHKAALFASKRNVELALSLISEVTYE